jgi:hypothetical protein
MRPSAMARAGRSTPPGHKTRVLRSLKPTECEVAFRLSRGQAASIITRILGGPCPPRTRKQRRGRRGVSVFVIEQMVDHVARLLLRLNRSGIV